MILGVVLNNVINFGGTDQSNPSALTLDPSLYLATVDGIVDNKITGLLYKDSVPEGMMNCILEYVFLYFNL